MSPRTTFQSCGSSSIDVRRITRPTRVIRASPRSTAKPGALPLGVDDHRAELEQLEVLAVLADAHLPEQHRPAVLELRRERGDGQQRARDDEPEPRERDVERAVQRVPSAASQVAGTPRRR